MKKQANPTVDDTLAAGQRVLVEIKVPQAGMQAGMQFEATIRATTIASTLGFVVDSSFNPVPVRPSNTQREAMLAANEDNQHIIVKATLTDVQREAAKASPEVIEVWSDPDIEPIACPIPPCDCSPGTPHGTIADVANYLGANLIWNAGKRGDGIVVGVVDGGITATGRTLAGGEAPTRTINNVIGGWPTDSWGTRGASWGYHGNMCSTDVLGMAPNCRIYDLRIAGASSTVGTISNALQAFQWAINTHASNGTPHILTNSWGIFATASAPDYVNNPNHPFTRKVVEAIDAGIIVLFAAGNCGDTCPDGRCASSGPGQSIWGANGHPRVMTVGAVNKDEQFVGYSSQGPASLDPHKPDFCSITHFTGYFNSDSGTSAATPIAAGVCALLKQGKPSATHDSIKNALIATAKDIGPAGWDQHSGAGIIGAKRAYDRLTKLLIKESKVEIKEIKERKLEIKEIKERKLEIKEKPEVIEGKRLKDLRDVIKRVPEGPIPIPDPIRDPIQLGQSIAGGGDLESRVAGLEVYIQSLDTFISADVRPDLSQGALLNEGDLQVGSDDASQLMKDASDAMMNKLNFDNSPR
jgi:subtilisin family serine protease